MLLSLSSEKSFWRGVRREGLVSWAASPLPHSLEGPHEYSDYKLPAKWTDLCSFQGAATHSL